MTHPSPTVSIVFLVFNRRDELRISLERMLGDSDYPRDRVEVIVVDNASQDGSGDMVAREFPDVRLIRRMENCGVSGINDGFAAATGDFVLALDDDCYLQPDGLRRAIELAERHDADLVSFGVTSSERDGYRFDHGYRTGLLTFWGCAVLVRRDVLERLGGYDPEIFVWANELEFMLRFFDAGFRHLHAPELVAVHMTKLGPAGSWVDWIGERPYLINQRHFAYIAAKHLHARDAAGALVALVATCLRDAIVLRRQAALGVRPALAGFARGLRHRRPVGDRTVSRTYRRSFHSFASPWWLSRPPHEFLTSAPAKVARRALGRPQPPKHPGRRELYFAQNARYYPTAAATLEMRNGAAREPALPAAGAR
jgi:GT2 family glycosyltransferase